MDRNADGKSAYHQIPSIWILIKNGSIDAATFYDTTQSCFVGWNPFNGIW
jgi:hypothetical protein